MGREFTIPKSEDSGDSSQEFHGVSDEIPSLDRYFDPCLEIPFIPQEPLEKTVFRLCDAVTDSIFYLFDKDAVTDLFNPLKLESCYQSKIKNTVLSKFQDSIKSVNSELSGFFTNFLFEVCHCIVCHSQEPHICEHHQKCMLEFVTELNGKISKSFGGQLFFRSWVDENGIKLEDHQMMQFLISNLLLVFKSLMQHMVWYLIRTEVNSGVRRGGKALETKTEFLGQSEFQSFSQTIMQWLTMLYVSRLNEFCNIKWKPGELQDMVRSLVVKCCQTLMGKQSNEPLKVRTLEKNASSVVCISTSKCRRSGSGFVWDKLGHIVTNYHVIDTASDYEVTFDDNSTCKAELVRFDKDKDIAVLHVHQKNLRPLSHGDSSELQRGDMVYAIGNPFGMYPGSCAAGIISFVGRDVQVNSIVQPIQNFIQTDVAVNPGNSGGPLLNHFGEFIGMITRGYASCGVAFAIPVDTVVHIVHQLLSDDGKVEQPFLGILCEPELSVEMGNLGMKGVPFKDAPKEGPAGRKGLVPTSYTCGGDTLRKLGDVITSVNGKEVTKGMDLIRILEKCKIDEEVTLEIFPGHIEEMTSGCGKKRVYEQNDKTRIHDHTTKRIHDCHKKTVLVKLESKAKLEETAGRKWGANYI